MMKIDILTLFPEMCETVMNESIIGRAQKKGAISVTCHQIREYTDNKQRQVDDAPYGGGMGVVMNAQPIFDCYQAVCNNNKNVPYTVYMSPQGTVLTQQKAVSLSKLAHICVISGHYEGVDERIIDSIVDEEISVGDYVLTGGELPALVMLDAVARLVPGVLSDAECFQDDSHFSGLLEYPQYTRPAVWNHLEVPAVLLSGNHAEIKRWRREQSLLRTFYKRPDLIEKAMLKDGLNDDDIVFLENLHKKGV